jgi:hypothetical protein
VKNQSVLTILKGCVILWSVAKKLRDLTPFRPIDSAVKRNANINDLREAAKKLYEAREAAKKKK